jgi:hypothetical protein
MIAARNYPIDCGVATSTPSRTFTKRAVRDRAFDVEAVASNRIITPGTVSAVVVQDQQIERQTAASYVTDYLVQEKIRLPGYSKAVSFSSSDQAVLSDPVAGEAAFGYQGSGNCTLFATAADGETAAIAVTASSFASSTSDRFTDWVSDSLAGHCTAQINSRLAGELPVFSQQDGTTFVRNPQCWVSSIDLTCASPWNSTGGTTMAGTLVSPRHVLFCEHYNFHPVAGATIKFVSMAGEVVSRTITALETHPDYTFPHPDLTLGVLDSDVPESITFAEVLPANWQSYLPNLAVFKTIPALVLNQQERATFTRLFTLSWSNRFYCIAPVPTSSYYAPLGLGDSGNPVFLLINSRPVILGPITYGLAGAGTFVTPFISDLNAMMASLGGGYQLTDVDLSGFPTY